MNTYMSRKEKELFTQLDALLAVSDNVLNLYKDVPSTDKEFLKCLRLGCTWLNKALNTRLEKLSADSVKDLKKNLSHMQVLVVPNDQVRGKFQEMAKMKSIIQMPYSEFEDWYGTVLQLSCGVCRSRGQNFKDCIIRKILMKYGISPVNTRATEDICQFSYPDAGIMLRDLTDKATREGLSLKEIAGIIEEKSPDA